MCIEIFILMGKILIEVGGSWNNIFMKLKYT